MRYNIVKIVYRVAFLSVLMISCSVCDVSAQGTPCEPDEPCSENPDDVPVDGGASVLIAAGVAYGLKKAYDKRKQNKETDVA
ncbi:PID-CTERM protein-sorting domain-containing protein [Pedobacter sp. SL55]|uniref:PID-CTERM protein-sorting domain-containing protein n=1 Tax=Pedobacter sp. SL55 TaxID=2995161 RepID=UPI00226F46FF|nr:hypothetical protein [Pedobacter sp. SL55]WAC42309.1 hypothetical protein OVA16_08125 [Pedobacter sp. SL55]